MMCVVTPHMVHCCEEFGVVLVSIFVCCCMCLKLKEQDYIELSLIKHSFLTPFLHTLSIHLSIYLTI